MKYRDKIQVWSNYLINFFIVLFAVISSIGSITLTKNLFQKISPGTVYVFSIIVLIIFGLIYFKSVRAYICDWIKERQNIIFIVLFIGLIIWQIYTVLTIVPFPRWDPMDILTKVMGQKQGSFTSDPHYFSIYPNNIFYVMLEKGFWIVLGRPRLAIFIQSIGIFNLLLVDISIIIVGWILSQKYNMSVSYIYMLFAGILIGISPWITIPYTDILAFGISSVNIAVIFLIQQNYFKNKIVLAITLGFQFIISYLTKPSLIIFFIALMIIYILKIIQGKQRINWKLLGAILVIICLGLVGYKAYSKTFIKVNTNENFSMTHFAAMGMKNSGGFYRPYVESDKKIKDPKKRSEHDIYLIRKQLKEFGNPINYGKFLVQKQIYNTRDGMFYWPESGTFSMKPYTKKKDVHLPQKFYLKKSRAVRNADYWIYMQIIISIVYLSMLFTFRNKDWFEQLIKYSIVGFFMFLLMFEAGRSRYLIQCLPFVLVLGSIGFNNLIQLTKYNMNKQQKKA